MSELTNSTPTEPPGVLRRVDTAGASALVDLAETFEELQTVLRCCERLVSALTAGGDEPDDVLIEAVWTVALLSYGRCFAPGDSTGDSPGVSPGDQQGATLTEDDLTAALSNNDVLDWHQVLVQLRNHHADPGANPRERFSVGVSQDDTGAPSGVAITSARQPLVDDLTVRQTGAIAFALSRLVNDRIAAQQQKVFGELKDMPKAYLDRLPQLDVAQPGSPG